MLISLPLADSACGLGCIASLPDGATSFTTIELKTNFLDTARDGAIACVARMIHGGRTTQVWDAVVAAYGEATRDAGHGEAEGLEQAGQVHRGGLALEVRVGAEDDLFDALGVHVGEQFLDAQLLGADAFDGADRALQHVVQTVELLGLLHGDDVPRLLDDADGCGVATVVAAHVAELALGHVPAATTERDTGLDLDDGVGQAFGVLLGQLQQVEGNALGRLGPDTRQTAELIDQLLDGGGVHSSYKQLSG